MTRFITAIAAVLLVTATASSAFAQAAIQEPGAYAFYHPNADTISRAPAYGSANAYYDMAPYGMAPARDAQARYRSAAPRHYRMVR